MQRSKIEEGEGKAKEEKTKRSDGRREREGEKGRNGVEGRVQDGEICQGTLVVVQLGRWAVIEIRRSRKQEGKVGDGLGKSRTGVCHRMAPGKHQPARNSGAGAATAKGRRKTETLEPSDQHDRFRLGTA